MYHVIILEEQNITTYQFNKLTYQMKLLYCNFIQNKQINNIVT